MIQWCMDSLIDYVWHNSSPLSLIGLAAALIGLVLIFFGLLDHLKKQSGDSDETMAQALWRNSWGKAGCVLLTFGIAFAVFVLTVRLMIPASD